MRVKAVVIGGIIVLFLIVGGVFLFNRPFGYNQPVSAAIAPIKNFIIDGSNYKFSPNEMTVKKGDTVRVTFKNSEGMHDFIIDKFNVKTKRLAAGEEEFVQFVADKTGSFEYYCSVAQHRTLGMQGTLKVE